LVSEEAVGVRLGAGGCCAKKPFRTLDNNLSMV